MRVVLCLMQYHHTCLFEKLPYLQVVQACIRVRVTVAVSLHTESYGENVCL